MKFEAARKIKLLVSDVDGVMTDGLIWLGNDNEEFKSFHARDGFGIKLALENGLVFAIITGRKSRIVHRRAQELGIVDVHQGVTNKWKVLCQLMDKYGVEADEVSYIGDDLNDLAIMRAIGFGISVADGVPELKRYAAYVTRRCGGQGAVREAIEVILKSQGKWEGIVEKLGCRR